MGFEWSDGWLLMSILYGGRGGFELTSIIRIGDMLNHSIFNKEEIEDGLARLISAGFVICDPPRYRATPRAVDLFKPIKRERLTRFNEVKALAQSLEAIPYAPEIETTIRISEDEFESALKRYLRPYRRRNCL